MKNTIISFIIFLAISSALILGAYLFLKNFKTTEPKQDEKIVQVVDASENARSSNKSVSMPEKVEQKNYKCIDKKTGAVIYSNKCPTSYVAEEIKAISKTGAKPQNSQIELPRNKQNPNIVIIKDIQKEINLCNVKYNKLISDTRRLNGCQRKGWCKNRLDGHKENQKLCIEDARDTTRSKNRYL